MIEIDIPGYKQLQLKHLVLDYNGTLASDGILLDGIESRLKALAEQLQIHVLTADTFGQVQSALAGISCRLSILPQGNQHLAKLHYVEQLDSAMIVCIGNGRNDRLMLQEAALGIVVMQEEGVAIETLLAADVAAPSSLVALDLLLHPLRLVATLQS